MLPEADMNMTQSAFNSHQSNPDDNLYVEFNTEPVKASFSAPLVQT